MGEQKPKLSFKFEELLDETPNVAYFRSANSMEAYRQSPPSTERAQKNVSFHDRKPQSDEMNLPDDQSLTSAFAELSVQNGSSLKNNTHFPYYCGGLLDPEYSNSMTNSLPDMNPTTMSIASFRSPASLASSFNVLSDTKSGQATSNRLKLDPQVATNRPFNFQAQQIETFPTTVPVPRGMQRMEFLPNNMSSPGVGLHLLSNQQQYLPHTHSTYSHLVNQSPLDWRTIEEEQYYDMHQQWMCLQHPIPANGIAARKPISQNIRQPHFQSIAHFIQQNQDPSHYGNGRTMGLNQPPNTLHPFELMAKQTFPEKFLTRSQGANTLTAVKHGSSGVYESPFGHNGKLLANGYLRQLDSLTSGYLADGIMDLKSTNVRQQTQKFSSLESVTGNIYIMAKDQQGCRLLQKKFSEGCEQEIQKIFLEIIDHIVELMTDPFGNYLVQKLLEVCTEDQLMQILHAITKKSGELVRISCDMHGTRVVQKVIETLRKPEQFSMIVSSLKPDIVTLIKNTNGNHVAQSCLQCLIPEYREFLFEATAANCVELATDRHGCCVLQKCLQHSNGEQKRSLVCRIASNANLLSQDPYGNYVVQYVIELELPWATAAILDELEGNFADLSMQKYSSNVVEKCLIHSTEERQARIIQEMINNSRLDQVMQDPYGNYVIQSALTQSKGGVYAALVEAIRPYIPALRTSPYGKKVLSHLKH